MFEDEEAMVHLPSGAHSHVAQLWAVAGRVMAEILRRFSAPGPDHWEMDGEQFWPRAHLIRCPADVVVGFGLLYLRRDGEPIQVINSL